MTLPSRTDLLEPRRLVISLAAAVAAAALAAAISIPASAPAALTDAKEACAFAACDD